MFESILKVFSSREWALIIWLIIGLLVILLGKSTRTSLSGLIKTFFQKKILFILLVALIYSSIPVLVFYYFKIWDTSLLKDVIFWYIGSGIVTIFGLNDKGESGHFKRMLLKNFKLMVIIQFIANVHKFSFIAELIILPIGILFGGMLGLAQSDSKYKPVENLINWVFAILSLVVLYLSLQEIILKTDEFIQLKTLKSFLQPIILSIWFVPFAFLLTVFMRYEVLFTRLGFFLKDKKLLRYAKWRIIWKGKANLQKVKLLSSAINELYHESTKEDIKRVIG